MATRGYNSWRHQFWGDPRTARPRQSYRWFGLSLGTVSNSVDVRWIPALEMLNAVFELHGYPVKSAGSWNLRRITNGAVWSPHAWPLAIDANPATNPYTGRGLVTDMPMALIEDVYRIRTAETDERVFKWGGDWDGDWDFDEHTVWDAMHFEIIVTPAELAEGVTFDGMLEVEVRPNMFVRVGDKGPWVEYWQKIILHIDPTALPVWGADKDYGNETAEAVRRITLGDGAAILSAEAATLHRRLAEAHGPPAVDHDLDRFLTRDEAAETFILAGQPVKLEVVR